jgi:protoporphyrinogen/coproporphyrinogen III oxidase
MLPKKPVVIVGAGMAGLTAANFLKQNNIPFILYEAGEKIAGLATSFKDKDGFSYDFGAHFITNRLAKAIGVSSQCELVKYYGESVWLKGRAYKYPFGLIKIPRMTFSWIENQLKLFQNGIETASAAEWFRKHYGAALANEVALPLIESWSGVPAENLSPALCKGLFGGNIAKTLFLKTAGIITGRAVACGYNKEKPETPGVWHVYPKGGLSSLCEKLSEGLKDSIKLNSLIEEIIVENEKAVAIRVKGEILEVAAVISTAPVNVLSKLVKGASSMNGTANFRYRPMVFVNLRFEGHYLLPDTVLWFPEKEFLFFRLTETTRSMPWLAPEGKTIITADIGCQINDQIWNMDEKKLAELCLDKISPLIPDAKQRFVGSSVLRTPVAYPVFLNEYEQERQNFEQSTNIPNLLSIGRNGEFSHMFMEDVYWRTRKKVSNLIKALYPD